MGERMGKPKDISHLSLEEQEKVMQLRAYQREKAKGYYQQNKEQKKLASARYREANPEKIKQMSQEYYAENSDVIKENSRRQYHNDPEASKQRNQEWSEKNPERLRQHQAKTRKRPGYREYMNSYQHRRRREDPNFKLAVTLRSRIGDALARRAKSSSATVLLGCSISEARAHLEKQFQHGMSWENHALAGWHIDHIRPCASFDLTDPEQQKQCFHFTNLQPLWAKDNLAKGDKWAA